MNYLAHLFLADDTPESILGNLLGDFVKGSAKKQYTKSIQQGIELHRKIDYYTDSHQVVRSAKQLVSLERRRYAGILVDIFYDHFLANHWQNYKSIQLHDFSQKVYAILVKNQNILPSRLGQVLPKMIEQNWLISYRQIIGIERAIRGISQRMKQGKIIVNSVEELQNNYHEFDLSFQAFFPDLIDYVKSQK